MKRIRTLLAGTAVGASLAYFFDPDRGKARRNKAADQFHAARRRSGQRAERQARYRAGQLEGLAHRATDPAPEETDVEDPRLKDRIESEVFSPEDFPKGQVNVTVVDGVAELRGQLRTPDDINRLVRAVEQVPGVVEVRSMLHLPDTPAPNKREAREAS
jgi:osmotically-inducible protein OsmY